MESGKGLNMSLKAQAAMRAGCVQLRRARQTGRVVGVYDSAESGIECDPDLPWTTVCEEHGILVCHPTKALALSHASDPEGWCEDCR